MMKHVILLLMGITVGFSYYHHIWLQAKGIQKRRQLPLFSFWVRYAILSIILALLFRLFPGEGPALIAGLFTSRPIYIFMNKDRIFGSKE